MWLFVSPLPEVQIAYTAAMHRLERATFPRVFLFVLVRRRVFCFCFPSPRHLLFFFFFSRSQICSRRYAVRKRTTGSDGSLVVGVHLTSFTYVIGDIHQYFLLWQGLLDFFFFFCRTGRMRCLLYSYIYSAGCFFLSRLLMLMMQTVVTQQRLQQPTFFFQKIKIKHRMLMF